MKIKKRLIFITLISILLTGCGNLTELEIDDFIKSNPMKSEVIAEYKSIKLEKDKEYKNESDKLKAELTLKRSIAVDRLFEYTKFQIEKKLNYGSERMILSDGEAEYLLQKDFKMGIGHTNFYLKGLAKKLKSEGFDANYAENKYTPSVEINLEKLYD